MSVFRTSCWCGSKRLAPFSAHYLRCVDCETLCVAVMPDPGSLLVADDEGDLYGSEYFDRMSKSHGFPPLEERARGEIPERCTYWLRSLLRRKLPPGSTLELGCSHGGFVALLRAAGFDATGLDLSPGAVEKARRRFDIPVLVGPLKAQTIAPGSLDAVILMDLLEHLAEPLETIRRCVALLKPDGILMIQVPKYREGKSYSRMQQENDPFLTHLIESQHLHLFSKTSVQLLLQRAGAPFVEFEPAIFGHYDMFLTAGRSHLSNYSAAEIAESLLSRPSRRMALALLDLYGDRQAPQCGNGEGEGQRPAQAAVFERLQRSLIFRGLRLLGLWGWVEDGLRKETAGR